MSKPRPQFTLNEIIKVDEKVCESGRARICGREYGPENRFKNYPGWFYILKEIKPNGDEVFYPPGGGMGFEADEREILKWGNLPNPVG